MSGRKRQLLKSAEVVRKAAPRSHEEARKVSNTMDAVSEDRASPFQVTFASLTIPYTIGARNESSCVLRMLDDYTDWNRPETTGGTG